MALKPVLLLFLWVLGLSADGAAASLCINVTCSTDYVQTLNCSCSDSAPSHPVALSVVCRDDDDDLDVKGSCVITPPRSWCSIHEEDLTEVASVGTMCTTTVEAGGPATANATKSFTWELCNVVKPQPPLNVTVADAGGSYNVSWLSGDSVCLTHRVRIRATADLHKEPLHLLELDGGHVRLDRERLEPRVGYTVDVRAKLCPGYHIQGPWSEWSSAAAFLTDDDRGMETSWLYVSVPVVFVLVFLVMGYLHKPCWLNKFRMMTYVPDPSEFFRPLEDRYGGNFKDWVKPAFNECDYVKMSTSAQMMSRKKYDILRWSNENYAGADGEVKEGGQFLGGLQPPGGLLLDPREAGSSEGAGQSTGHISIHTVTISGESFGEGDTSQSSLRSYRDGESFGSDRVGYDLQEPPASRMDEQSRMLPQRQNQLADDLLIEENMNFHPEAQFMEAERVSLDSFVSNEQSEDGYPHVDLDTVDSGFGECGSPGVSDSNRAELIDSFLENKNTNSNYVKQWMICSTIHEDASGGKDEVEDAQKL
ncbi:interleukin 21 receptor, tandem duplicate 1 [Cololabis saira]|uniref:interleukin 21 receptor, tandem duplicate 1 n=1 Tax=Cololabis saira TaxID=129043 RepID=UPI002AD44984|nr:interleukin 21 receptor, tandem duplicate 1 [Cololabis saira]